MSPQVPYSSLETIVNFLPTSNNLHFLQMDKINAFSKTTLGIKYPGSTLLNLSMVKILYIEYNQ